MDQYLASFWGLSCEEVLKHLKSNTHGLTRDEAKTRLSIYCANVIIPRKISGAESIFISQFKSPIIIILFFAAGLSFFLESFIEASMILFIILFSGLLGYFQEKGAANAVENLLQMVQISSEVMRDQEYIEIPVEYLVPVDIIRLKAGDIIPVDCLILESRDLFVDGASMTGETFPVEKSSGISKKDAPVGMRKNALFMGTHAVSGSAAAVIVLTGKDIPEMTISTDSVDSEMVDRPEKWDIGFIRSFMVVFGILSSLFDYLTFGALLFIMNASTEQFRTGWFIVSYLCLHNRARYPHHKTVFQEHSREISDHCHLIDDCGSDRSSLFRDREDI